MSSVPLAEALEGELLIEKPRERGKRTALPPVNEIVHGPGP